MLGVACRSTPAPEVDIGLNLRFDWDRFNNKAAIANAVMLHEEGHFGGAGHSQTSSAVMFRFIDTDNPLLTLQEDDKEAMRFLYPENTVTVSGLVQVDDDGAVMPADGATVSLTGTGLTVQTDPDGTYTFGAVVPDDVHYDVVASLGGDSASDDQVLVAGNTTVDLTIVASNGDDGGPGFCPPGHARRGLC